MSDERIYIGTLAQQTGVPAETIRYWEGEDVLPEPERSDAGYRLYEQEATSRVRFVRKAQALGLQLDEIAEILALVEERGVEPCAHVEAKLRDRFSQVRKRIRELGELRERLESALERAEAAPGSEDCRCRIIEGREGQTKIEIEGVGAP